MELNRAVAENIKRIRKSKKLSMERLAAESGVSRSMLGQIERGEANPSVAILGKLAAALKVPAEVLLENGAEAFEEGTLVSGSSSGHDNILGHLLVDNHLGEIEPVSQYRKDNDDNDDNDAAYDNLLLQIDLREIYV